MRLYVSYTSTDPMISNENLNLVESRIKPYADVFIDILHNKDKNQKKIEKEVSKCDAVLQLVFPQSHSEIHKDILTALKENKPIIKVSVEELLNMDEEQIYLLISNVEKKGWSVWAILTVSLFICLTISVLGLYLSYLFVSCQIIEYPDGILNARGLFGDSWGGVNAIISAFAFAGVIVTLFLQNRDLNLQRKEMSRQSEEFAKENETIKYQRFENLFYNMLNLQQEIVAALRFDHKVKYTLPNNVSTQRCWSSDIITGRDVFRYTFEDIEIPISRVFKGYREYLGIEGLGSYDNTWIPTIFDHYFRHLYKIIQFVDNQKFSYEETYKYISMLRGTLSRYELVWLYYNALNPSFTKFKKLIEKYSLLKNIREDLLSTCSETKKYYDRLGISKSTLQGNGFSGSDFEFYLTNNADDTKYNISAFWNKEIISEGIKHLNRWNHFIDISASKVISNENF